VEPQCLACGLYPADTIEEVPPLCALCLERAGDEIEPGARVICTVDNSCSGIIDRLENDDQLAVVRTNDGGEAWIPIQELVRATC
jgi:hypothetical protein